MINHEWNDFSIFLLKKVRNFSGKDVEKLESHKKGKRFVQRLSLDLDEGKKMTKDFFWS